MNEYYLNEQIINCEDTGEVCKGYNEYLKSKHWELLRYRLIPKGCVCGLCGKSGKVLQLHHRIYKRLGREKNRDLVPLCMDCHKYVHTQDKWYDVEFPYWVVGGGSIQKQNSNTPKHKKSKKKSKSQQRKNKKQLAPKQNTSVNINNCVDIFVSEFFGVQNQNELITDSSKVNLMDTMSGKYSRKAIQQALQQERREFLQFMKWERKQERKRNAELRRKQMELQARSDEQVSLIAETKPHTESKSNNKGCSKASIIIVNGKNAKMVVDNRGNNENAENNTRNT